MSGYTEGNRSICACGCGQLTSTSHTVYRLGHRPVSPNKVYVWQRSQIDGATGCIEWTGSRFSNGYGSASRGPGSRQMAHRLAYETFVGPIPTGLVIDHLCRNRACVNVTHMEPVTPGVNALRGGGLAKAVENARNITHCVHGQEYTPENTIRDRGGKRRCRKCGREASLAWYHRTKAERVVS